MVWMFVSLPPQIHNLTPKVMALDGAFSRWLDHKGGTLMIGLVAL